MGLTDSFNIGRTALTAQQAALQVVGNNIANVNTPGYHRQRAILEQLRPQSSAAGEIGTGVRVATISSVRDQFLEIRIAQSSQNAGKQQAIAGYLGHVETDFSSSASGIQTGISKFLNSFSALASDPTSLPLRYGVVSAASNLTATFRTSAKELFDLRENADGAVVDTIREINSLTSTIAGLNQQIITSEAGGTEASALRDQRSEALNQLSSLVGVHFYDAGDGSLSVVTSGGDPLVTSNVSEPLEPVAAPNGFANISVGGRDITASLTGGKLGGLLDVRDRLLPAYQNDLDTLAESIISQVNTLHEAGTDLQDPPTSPSVNLFTPVATIAGAASAFKVNPVVAGDVKYLAAGQSGSPGDNANAVAIADLESQRVVGGAQTFAEAFAALQFKIGVDQQTATQQLDTENSLLTQLNNSRDAVSGVSLDEEAVDMIRFQRAYQASARFINIIDQLTAEIMGLVD